MEHVGDGDGGGDRHGGSRGGGRDAWGSLYTNPPPLRRPHTTVNQQTASVNQVNEMINIMSIDEVVKNSDLSAEAVEFVPRSFVPIHGNQHNQHQSYHRPSARDRLVAARNQSQPMHNAQAHYHYGNQQHFPQHLQQVQYHQYVDSDQSQGYSQYGDGFNNFDRNQDNRNVENSRGEPSLPNVLSQLNVAMQTLSRNPDQFENLVVPLVCSITPHLKLKINTEAIVSAVILKCISDANFRYSGARLCSHLDSVDTPLDDIPSIFRTALYERCRGETASQAADWPKIINHVAEDERKCHGLMLSLAELVAQMDTRPASILGKLLVEVISIALKNPGPNTAKYVCQSLKLAGQYLERDSSTNREEVERVMGELSELVINGRVDVHVGRMINSVKELRNGNWGRVVSSHGPTPVEVNQTINQQQQQQVQAQHQFDEPVLYGPDGTILSAEERRFCQDLANLDEGSDEPWQSSGPNDQLEEDEDDIIAAAYEEFLKLPPNNNTGGIKRG